MTRNKLLQVVLELLKTADPSCWRLSVLCLKAKHEAHAVPLSSRDDLRDYLCSLSNTYIGGDDPLIDDETDIVEYDGSLHETPVEYLSEKDVFFKEEYCGICHALEGSSIEGKIPDIDYNAIALSYAGESVRGIKGPIHLIFKRRPFVMLKNRFYWFDNSFRPITAAILTLPSKMDLLIAGKEAFIFSDSGAGIANDNEGLKKEAERQLEGLATEAFIRGCQSVATVGLKRKNLRLFRAMDEKRKEQLRDKKFCSAMAKQFSIPCKGGVMDATDPRDAERLLKLLCKRGMVDPFVKDAVEVSGSMAWKRN